MAQKTHNLQTKTELILVPARHVDFTSIYPTSPPVSYNCVTLARPSTRKQACDTRANTQLNIISFVSFRKLLETHSRSRIKSGKETKREKKNKPGYHAHTHTGKSLAPSPPREPCTRHQQKHHLPPRKPQPAWSGQGEESTSPRFLSQIVSA